VRRTKNSWPLLHPFSTGNFFRRFVLLFGLITTSALGQQSLLMLGTISYDQSPKPASAASRTVAHHSSDSFAYFFVDISRPGFQDRLTAWQPPHPYFGSHAFSFANFTLDSSTGSFQRDWLQLARKKTDEVGRTGFWRHIEAGYGQFSQLGASFGSYVIEPDQPGFPYLKAHFTF